MLLAEDLLVLLVPTAVGELPRRSGTQAALAAADLEVPPVKRAVHPAPEEDDDFTEERYTGPANR